MHLSKRIALSLKHFNTQMNFHSPLYRPDQITTFSASCTICFYNENLYFNEKYLDWGLSVLCHEVATSHSCEGLLPPRDPEYYPLGLYVCLELLFQDRCYSSNMLRRLLTHRGQNIGRRENKESLFTLDINSARIFCSLMKWLKKVTASQW